MGNILENALHLFQFYKELGTKAIDRLDDQEIHWQPDRNANSVAIIAKHMAGNMLSRWTDFLNSDGEKEWRNRDSEFEDTIQTKNELLNYWEKGWETLFNALNSLSDDALDQTIYIRKEPHLVTEAIHRQLTHYAYHVGQIVYIAKTIKSDEWESLSIPEGQSESFNKEKFREK